MTYRVTARRQRGVTFANFVLVAILVVFAAIGGMKIVPAYVDNRTIAHILDTVAHDPDMQGAQPSDIRNAFEKRAMINNVTAVGPEDVEIQKTPAGMVLRVKYNVKIELIGNASLLLEFDTSSSRMR